jgi:hypothetical protein
MSRRSSFLTLCGLLLLLGTGACSVPLAPGYEILKETREVRFVPGDAPVVNIGANFLLRNSGTADLEFIDIILPETRAYGRNDLRVEVDGRPVALVELPEEFRPTEPNTMRLPFDAVWKRGEKRALAVEYNFRSPKDLGDRITIGPQEFHLSSRGWMPLPQPPKHFLAPYPTRPSRTTYTVIVPADFEVFSGGHLKGRKQTGASAEYRFENRKSDLTPAIVAGRYTVSPAQGKSAATIFWTLQPLQDDPRTATGRINAVWQALQKDFGPLQKNIPVPRIVESTGVRDATGDPFSPAAVDFPGGVLVNPALLSYGLNSDAFQEIVAHEIAHNWFGDEVFVSRFTAIGLGEGLPEYATIVAERETKGIEGRRALVSEYLRNYDQARTGINEIPLGVTTRTDPPSQQFISEAKAALFFVAVEDACGEKSMHDGLKELIALLHGQEMSYGALRSELEHVSGKNLADVFRVWLNEKDVPADFRARYPYPPNRLTGSSSAN